MIFVTPKCVLNAAWLLHQTGWTNDVKCFLQWLSCIEFSASSFCDAAIAEGLAQALTVCIAIV